MARFIGKPLPPDGSDPPLHLAALVGDHAQLEALAARGAALDEGFDARAQRGAWPTTVTPLMVAAGSGEGASVETLELLVRLGARLDVDLGSGTAASFAVGRRWRYQTGGDARRLQWLLAHGLDAEEQVRGVSLLAQAASNGGGARLQVLLAAGARPDPPPGAEHAVKVPLLCAAEHATAADVRTLLAAGADPHVHVDGETALFFATSPETVAVLLDAGLELEARNELGWTPLMHALVLGHLRRVRTLLSAGADVSARTGLGQTVFMTACGSHRRSATLLRMLVDAGADPHAVYGGGWNAAHAAVEAGEANTEESATEIYGMLKELGVDLNSRAPGGPTPLAWARAEEAVAAIAALEALGALGSIEGDSSAAPE
ncbi:MAG: ankyrin repeat domain-containing protein [Kofleriaceae bacterium]